MAVASDPWVFVGFPGTFFFSVNGSWDSGSHNPLLYLDFPSLLSSDTLRTDHLSYEEGREVWGQSCFLTFLPPLLGTS